MTFDWSAIEAALSTAGSALVLVVGWLWRRRALIQKYTEQVFKAIEARYPPGQSPGGLVKTEEAVKQLSAVLDTHKFAVTANELERIKLQWAATAGEHKLGRVVMATVPALLTDVKAPGNDLPAPVAAPPPSIDDIVKAVLAALPSQPQVDEAVIAEKVLQRLAEGLSKAGAP